jgi:very-short-patch-repair endonuclease
MPRHHLTVAARRQHGLFTYHQALAAGISHDAVARHVRSGRWQELEPAVFRALPAGRPTFEQRLMALVLSTGGVAYGRSAVALYGLLDPPRRPEVLVVRAGRNRVRSGLHSTRALPAGELTTVRGVPSTMPGRSVIDACATLSFGACCALVDAAVVRALVRPESLARRAEELRNAKRPGCTKVLRALAEQHPQLERARNEWEALALRLARRFGLPDPVPNHPVHVGQRRVLDLAWPDALVVLEFDGFAPHMVRDVFDDDRARQNALVAAGWTVFRATSRLLERDPRAVFAPIAAAIAARGHETSQKCEVS